MKDTQLASVVGRPAGDSAGLFSVVRFFCWRQIFWVCVCFLYAAWGVVRCVCCWSCGGLWADQGAPVGRRARKSSHKTHNPSDPVFWLGVITERE